MHSKARIHFSLDLSNMCLIAATKLSISTKLTEATPKLKLNDPLLHALSLLVTKEIALCLQVACKECSKKYFIVPIDAVE